MDDEQALQSCSMKDMEVCFRDFITDGADKNQKKMQMGTEAQ